jgi:predicted lactoylglutathione lyase
MATKIFVNLPVADLKRSKAFYTGLGWTINEHFSDETAASVVVSDDIYVMLLTHDKFKQFTPRPISDAAKGTEVLLALSCDSRAHVDDMVKKALAAGGGSVLPPQDLGFMYSHGFQDPDGHIWEVFYMDPGAVPTNS